MDKFEHTWRNVVAFTAWKCKLCGYAADKDAVVHHLQHYHGIRSIVIYGGKIHSDYFVHPNILDSNWPEGEDIDYRYQ